EPTVIYNIHNGETFGILIAIYFYLTGLSAGSFILSTLAYGFGIEKYRPLGKIGVVLATLLLVIAPLFLLFHVGQPLRAWHLFFLLRGTSPITWGSFLLTLYPLNCLIYGFFMFRGYARLTRIFGLIGIPLAIAVHGYTGFILSFGKARALWNSSLMPLLFLVSAMVSGIALMILVSAIKDRFFSKEKKINRELIFGLAKLLGWVIVLDLFLMFCEITTHFVSHREAYEVNMLLLTGSFAIWFVVVETLIGKLIPLGVFLTPKFRSLSAVLVASVLVMVGIFFMRYNVVLGGEYLPLI
ncbi:MAG: polysulfide reductase NrfD, partial [candidate division KSB1 bacterium]|nr:polysulfide reductase NrfD [candidate division KSB1 bacterium]